jgi:hypothetical protein
MPQETGLDLFDAVNDAVLGAFGEPAKFTLVKKGAAPLAELDGIFDARHFAVEIGGEVAVSDYQTTLACRRDAIGDVGAGDAVIVRGATYDVADIRPDSEGWVVLVLSLAIAAEDTTS